MPRSFATRKDRHVLNVNKMAPRKNQGGQRVYQDKDLDMVLDIKRMLHEEGFTIAGARKKLSEPAAGRTGGETVLVPDDGEKEKLADALGKFKDELKDILDIIK